MTRTIITIFSLLLFFSCGYSSAQEKAMPDFRIISTAPNATEILFALGLDDNIVGVSEQCNYPPKAKDKTKIGTFSRPNIEKIASLKPDIVFTTGLEQDAASEYLGKLGIRTVTIYPRTIEELYQSIREAGELTGRKRQAEALVRHMATSIGRTARKAAAVPPEKRKTFLIEIMDNPLMVAAGNSFPGRLGAIAGGRNIAYDTDRPYARFSPEIVIQRNPDCIILGHMFRKKDALKKVKQRLGWSGINAVKNGVVFNDINPDILLRPSPRTPQAVKEIYARLYGQ